MHATPFVYRCAAYHVRMSGHLSLCRASWRVLFSMHFMRYYLIGARKMSIAAHAMHCGCGVVTPLQFVLRCSYKRVKGRSHTVEKRKASHPQKPHACASLQVREHVDTTVRQCRYTWAGAHLH